ncbi:MAG: EthD family reductase [Paracoccaceae bacterium]
MAVSVQVLYPVGDDTTFDYDYYTTTHMDVVNSCMGPHFDSVVVIKGLAGGPDTPPGFHAIATIICKDQAALDAMLAAADPAMADIPNFTNVQPQLLIGEVIY